MRFLPSAYRHGLTDDNIEHAAHGNYDGEEMTVFYANYATARIIDRLKGESR